MYLLLSFALQYFLQCCWDIKSKVSFCCQIHDLNKSNKRSGTWMIKNMLPSAPFIAFQEFGAISEAAFHWKCFPNPNATKVELLHILAANPKQITQRNKGRCFPKASDAKVHITHRSTIDLEAISFSTPATEGPGENTNLKQVDQTLCFKVCLYCSKKQPPACCICGFSVKINQLCGLCVCVLIIKGFSQAYFAEKTTKIDGILKQPPTFQRLYG